jgi:hypothetical protein
MEILDRNDRVLAYLEESDLLGLLSMVAEATSSSSLISEIKASERSVPSECIKDCSFDRG